MSGARAGGPGYPVTPDGRYFVAKGRLWRMSDPRLDEAERGELVRSLTEGRRLVGKAQRSRDAETEAAARRQVDAAKTALGERGPVWWADGAPDYNRQMVGKTPYAA